MRYFRNESRVLAVAGVLAIVLGACTQDFGAYEGAGQELESLDDGGTEASRTTPDASRATGDAASDAGVCAACTSRWGACSKACDKTYDDCEGDCKGGSRCRFECRWKRDACRNGCQSECRKCAGDACAPSSCK